MLRVKLSNEYLYLVAACVIAVLSIMPIAFFGIPDSNDLPQHYRFAQIYFNSLSNGEFFPGWAGNENFGYGDIGLRFYPPLAYYVLASARILVGNWYDASWLTFTFWMILGCIGIFCWARCWLSVKQSAIAAIIYIFVPWQLSQLYSAFYYAQFAASCVLPFCFAFVTKVFQRGKASDVLGLSIAYAVLLITHLPLAVIGSLSLFIYALTFLEKKNFVRALIKAAIGFGLGLSASSFYWFKMVTEMKWLNLSTERYKSDYYSFQNNFYPALLQNRENFSLYNALLSDTAILLNLLFLFTAIFYFIYKRRTPIEQSKNIFQTVLPIGWMAFFMATILSRPIWELITPLQKVQFPARWITVVGMCGAIVTAASIKYILKGNFLKKRVWTYSCVFVVTIVLLFDFTYIFHPISFAPIAREKFETQMQILPEEESFDWGWTIWSRNKAFERKERVLADNRKIEVKDWQTETRSFNVVEGSVVKARIATFYYPHWQATVNGVSVEIEKDENGVMLVPLPAEKSVVHLEFKEPLAVKIASVISISAWLFILFAVLFLARNKFTRLRSPNLHFAEEEFSC